jgi:hypothetical protein
MARRLRTASVVIALAILLFVAATPARGSLTTTNGHGNTSPKRADGPGHKLRSLQAIESAVRRGLDHGAKLTAEAWHHHSLASTVEFLGGRLGAHQATHSGVTDALSQWGYLNVRSFGAVGDGETDDTAAFQTALAQGAGGKVFVPAGQYVINSTLTVQPGTLLEGINAFPFASTNGGSVLITNAGQGNAQSTPFIWLSGDNAGVKGLTIQYQNQDPSQTSPTVYPACIGGQGNDLSVVNMLLLNPYWAIDFSTNSCPRHLIDNVYGQPLAVGISVDQIYDIGRIRHVHFWPFWAGAGTNLCNWVNANGVTFHFFRSDWEVVEDVFSWGYNIGMLFDESQYGALNGQFTDIDFDNVNIGLQVLASQPYGLMFSNLNLANAGNGQTRVAVQCPPDAKSSSHVVIRGMVTWGDFITPVYWNCGSVVSVSDSIFNAWNKTSAAVVGLGGRVSVRNSYFQDAIGTAVSIAASVDRAIVTGNDLIGNAVNCDGGDRLCTGNLA